MNRQLFTPKGILGLILVLFYAAGMLCLILNAVPAGMLLWTVSLLGSCAYLDHFKRKRDQQAEAERLRRAANGEDESQCE